ncbi:nodulation protein NfeD [Marinobacter bryozoorum]|uniref:NfeD family protein n=1 Tax=Marinobacter bryozoorum TaxID=256324 RepID=UPI002006A8E8|nr:nodulation protein NfeD [Marinobacter bryozoorum]MCK7543678.1 nodulation protein NfeD [Marinobacter bryozoorum]
MEPLTAISRPPRHRYRLWLGLLLLGLALSVGQWVLAQSSGERTATVLTIDGAIGPATMDYVVRGIEDAEESGAALVVIRMDTPGGLMDSTRSLIKAILASEVPVMTWVAPSGARAASAGTYILYASHIAAMSPATNLGSATPVQMGGMPGSDQAPDDSGSEPGSAEEESTGDGSGSDDSSTAMERKVMEDAVSYIRGLADRHGRNADWAEQAVREAVNLGAAEALEKNVVDVVASSLDELLSQVHGREVAMVSGTRTLDTENLAIVRQQPDWRTSLLSVITDPNVAYFLMIIGFYGIIFELANPGSLYPGVIGAICLVLALFAFQVLSVNYAGLALILLGLAFIVGEAFMPSFGMLGVGGIVAFVLGSVILMDGSHQAISLPAVGGTAAVAGGFILWTVTRFMGLRRKAPAVGAEHMAEERCQALDDFSSDGDYYRGHVRLSGERWNAISDDAIVTGQWLRVQSLEGLTVKVIPVQKDHSRKEAL